MVPELDRESFAAGMLFNGATEQSWPRKIGAPTGGPTNWRCEGLPTRMQPVRPIETSASEKQQGSSLRTVFLVAPSDQTPIRSLAIHPP
jgi:hypothetical protein